MPNDPIPDLDPNEAYELIPSPAGLGLPSDWWTVTCNGIPVMHFSAAAKQKAERYIKDPTYRQEKRTPQKLWEKGKS